MIFRILRKILISKRYAFALRSKNYSEEAEEIKKKSVRKFQNEKQICVDIPTFSSIEKPTLRGGEEKVLFDVTLFYSSH